jgi:hypothetical protein
MVVWLREKITQIALDVWDKLPAPDGSAIASRGIYFRITDADIVLSLVYRW